MAASFPLERTPPRVLAPGATFDSVANAARIAGLAFVNGSRWRKRELAGWLTGAYGRATSFAPARSGRPMRAAESAPMRSGEHRKTIARRDDEPISHEKIAALLGSTRWRVLSALENAALPRGTFPAVDRAIVLRHVEPAIDANGNLGWIPVDGARMTLADRVLSLFAVDYLLRQPDYANGLSVCHYCETVSFDPHVRDRGGCARAIQHFKAASTAVSRGGQ